MIKGHNGYERCFACEIKGEKLEHRMIFPQTKQAKWRRRNQEDIETNGEKVIFN